MAIKTGHYDTHPSLKDRLEALKSEPKLPEPVQQSAALRWFDSKLPNIIKDFDIDWLKRNSSKWRERYLYVKQNREKLAELKAKPLQQQTSDELWQLASLTEELTPDKDSLPLYELYSQKHPNDANSDFAIGRLLLARNDENGVEKMKQAIDKRPHLKLNACDWLIYYYRGRNDGNAANFWQKQADQQMDLNYAAERERGVITANDQFIKPDRQTDVDTLFTNRLKKIKEIQSAWLAEKRMQYYPDYKTYILVIEKGYFVQETKLIRRILSRLDNNNCTYFVIMKSGSHNEIAEHVINRGITLF